MGLFFYKNRGILIPLYVIVCVIGSLILSKLFREYDIIDFNYDTQITLGIGLLLSGFWTSLTSKDFIRVKGQKERIYLDNSFYFLPMGLWGYILIIGGILVFISGLLETFVGS